MKFQCSQYPNHPQHQNFVANVSVWQEWIIDSQLNKVHVLATKEPLQPPTFISVVICFECGKQAELCD